VSRQLGPFYCRHAKGEGKRDRLALRCETSDGPWNAILTIDRFCFGTCMPLNSLIVVGVPNNVSFVWWGAVENHPDGFDFVGEPVHKSTTTQPCHPQDGGVGGGDGGGHIP
jgi:hypothetical protein